MITILGPTACGKTHIATEVAYRLGGEIISADSRQVFRGMDIGTGKDLSEYRIHGVEIPYHLIDICDPGFEYNAYMFQRDFYLAYDKIAASGKTPILCGGTGLYMESVLLRYPFCDVPENPEIRTELAAKTDEELTEILKSYVKLHNHTDTESRDRLIRAIEIQMVQRSADIELRPPIEGPVFGVNYPRETVMQRIRTRLVERLETGMVEEIRELLDSGVSAERLKRYGLEYRYVTMFLEKEISYGELVEQLNIAIRQFAKRQMTWFRRMERKGVPIIWIEHSLNFEEKIDFILEEYASLQK